LEGLREEIEARKKRVKGLRQVSKEYDRRLKEISDLSAEQRNKVSCGINTLSYVIIGYKERIVETKARTV
jgi:hypothetical protein